MRAARVGVTSVADVMANPAQTHQKRSKSAQQFPLCQVVNMTHLRWRTTLIHMAHLEWRRVEVAGAAIPTAIEKMYNTCCAESPMIDVMCVKTM